MALARASSVLELASIGSVRYGQNFWKHLTEPTLEATHYQNLATLTQHKSDPDLFEIRTYHQPSLLSYSPSNVTYWIHETKTRYLESGLQAQWLKQKTYLEDYKAFQSGPHIKHGSGKPVPLPVWLCPTDCSLWSTMTFQFKSTSERHLPSVPTYCMWLCNMSHSWRALSGFLSA